FLWLIAFFILGIAWVNYINLATAKASERAREVGIRKMMGSHTATLMPQFLGEALLTNLLAAAIAVVLAWIALPLFNGLTGQALSLTLLTQVWFWLIALGVLLLGSFLSGLYPALILSSFQPVKVLKGSFTSSRRGILLRKLLVGLQFGISLLLIAGTLTVYRQLSFMRSQDLGVDIDQTLVLKAPNMADSTYADRLTAMKTEMARHAAVRTVANSTSVPGRKASWNAGGIRRVGEPESASKQYRVIGVDEDFVEAYGLSIAHGRSFDESYGTEESKVLFNESAMKLMEFEDAESALGEEIFFWGDTFQIVGILEDYHQQSLKVAHDPLIFRFIPGSRTYFSVKIEAGTDAAVLPAVLTHLEESWRDFFPESPMEYFFLDDYFAEQYNNDQQFGQAFGVFAILAILIACLGLVGLTSFTTLQRTKEVGIRKILGASEGNIVHLLTKDVLLLIGIAAVIVLPVAGYLMNMWLEEFAYHISLDWLLFLLPVLFLTLITLLSVGIQTMRAARTNPIDAMRYE
ncbi:MAG: FtsX-like permease family protein, partial [Bacteroidota bacterium]